jgi:hypothetical protein
LPAPQAPARLTLASQARSLSPATFLLLFDQPRPLIRDVSNASNRDGRLAGLRVKQ